ncbi:mechanosensitive ion channel family protein [Ascidiimonas sp. W6]|uniref:mechanosensitive ion channel family protein n=1 Tax=Ascidiimonas meishanensis TaxID=3128903 RepID=UPI0030EF1A25
MIEKWSRQIFDLLISRGVSETIAIYLNLLTNIILLGIVIFIFDRFLRGLVIKAFKIFSNKTKTTFDDYLVKSKFPKYVAHIVPFIIIEQVIPYLLVDFPKFERFFLKLTDVYLVFLIVWILRSILRSTRAFLKAQDNFKDKPIDSYSQIVMIILWFFGITVMFSVISGESAWKFLTTLGAASAILLFVFKDTILGFVASISVSANDMVRIGDWITQEKYGADGDVVEINLTTVKVRNFDNTITTIPTYALISDSFRNWRGMQESGGRRIKRALYLKVSSVKFLTPQDLKRLSKIQIISQFIEHRQKDIDKFNSENGYDKSLIVNGRNQTNLGLFRKYCDLYLNNHPATNKDLMIMTRHLEPTPKGIPLEIYVFSSDKRWGNYERIMADILEHLIASVSYFELEIFELPTSKDLLSMSSSSHN